MNTKFNDKIFKNFPELESKRLFFKKLIKKDAEVLFHIRSNEQVMKYMDSIVLKTKGEAKALIHFFNWQFKKKNGITWGIFEKSTNKLIGTIAYWRLIKQHCRAEIGFSLLPEYWGKGFMTETFKIILEFGFNTMQLHSIEANVNPQNVNSFRLLERVGFRKEAYFREDMYYNNTFLDSAIYCLLETDLRKYE